MQPARFVQPGGLPQFAPHDTARPFLGCRIGEAMGVLRRFEQYLFGKIGDVDVV